jgi:hypothetical protein
MLYKIKNKPLWYRIWGISVAMSALCGLYLLCLDTTPKFFYVCLLYTFGSVLLDSFLFPDSKR